MSKAPKIQWLPQPEEHDYPAAESFLSLTYPPAAVAKCSQKLKSAGITEFKAKDIFRASRLPLLGPDNYHVDKDRKKIEKGLAISPLLLIQDQQHGKVIIADGYHRLCAVYSYDEDAMIPCKIAPAP